MNGSRRPALQHRLTQEEFLACHKVVSCECGQTIELTWDLREIQDQFGILGANIVPELSPQEARLFGLLYSHGGKWVSRGEMTRYLLGPFPSSNYIGTMAWRLRKKLRDTQFQLETKPGIGLRLVIPAEHEARNAA